MERKIMERKELNEDKRRFNNSPYSGGINTVYSVEVGRYKHGNYISSSFEWFLDKETANEWYEQECSYLDFEHGKNTDMYVFFVKHIPWNKREILIDDEMELDQYGNFSFGDTAAEQLENWNELDLRIYDYVGYKGRKLERMEKVSYLIYKAKWIKKNVDPETTKDIIVEYYANAANDSYQDYNLDFQFERKDKDNEDLDQFITENYDFEYSSFEEFLENEFRDEDYMESILDSILYKEYLDVKDY